MDIFSCIGIDNFHNMVMAQLKLNGAKMYDVEMMQMLNLIHAENRMIFELVKANMLIDEEGRKEITFDFYEDEYKRIIKGLDKYSSCIDCGYKNRFEKMKDIFKDREVKQCN